MVPEKQKIEFAPIEIPRVHRSPWGFVKIGLVLALLGGAALAWWRGYRPPQLFADSRPMLRLYEVDQGDIDVVVVENGTIESATSIPVRCKVEAIMGTTSSTQGATGKSATGGSGGSAQGSAGGASGAQGGSSGSGSGGQTSGATSKSSSKSSAKKKAGSSSSSTAKSGSTSGSGSSSSSSSSSSSGTSGSSTSSSSTSTGSSSTSGSSSGSSSTGTTAGAKPVIRSFTYSVTPHTPLRPVTAKAADTSATKKQTQAAGAGGRGGGGGGGRGGRGGGRGGTGGEEEKPGSTRIVEILPEGSKVKAGDIVCKLDSAALEDEEQAQQIRFLQAKSYVEQAKAIYEVNLITLKEYRDGILPSDLQLVRHYIETCQLERDRLERNLAWSRAMNKKGFRTTLQANGDSLAFEQAVIALREAEGMLSRLEDQTGPKILKSLEANVKAIQSDMLTQEAAFELEKQRLERIQRNIRYCTVTAPGDGIVVYVNTPDWSGRVMFPIDQGVALRQDQPIFTLPDPNHMRVKARVNESKVSMIHAGLPARILIDAYPKKPLNGTVAEVNAINTPINGSDVRIYYVNVNIDEGFADLKPGLSAEVSIRVAGRRKVTRVPIEALRWTNEQPFVALHDQASADAGKESWRWQAIEVGFSDTQFAEVVNGLKVGDRVVFSPHDLPEPKGLPAKPPQTSVADVSLNSSN